jgi:hypothetical protein
MKKSLISFLFLSCLCFTQNAFIKLANIAQRARVQND